MERITLDLVSSQQTKKFLAKQPIHIQKRLIEGMYKLMVHPFEDPRNIKPLKGTKDQYRLRVGKYRIVFEVDRNARELYILTIDSRGDVYKRLR